MKRGMLLFSFSIFLFFVSAQKIMLLNDSLKANSEALSVKMRGGSNMKYDFGDFKTLTSKAGWVKTKTKSKFFSGKEEAESKQNSSIEIVANEKDTATINVAINIKEESVRNRVISFSKDRVAWEREEDPSKLKQERNLVADITTSMDTNTWNFVYIDEFDIEKAPGKLKANGFISDGTRNIEIKSVKKWDNGKSPTFYSKVGFEFFLDGAVVGAVQNPMDTFQKKFVWLKNDLDDYMKLVLASSAVLLLTFGILMPD